MCKVEMEKFLFSLPSLNIMVSNLMTMPLEFYCLHILFPLPNTILSSETSFFPTVRCGGTCQWK